jgi:hypothetical protein
MRHPFRSRSIFVAAVPVAVVLGGCGQKSEPGIQVPTAGTGAGGASSAGQSSTPVAGSTGPGPGITLGGAGGASSLPGACQGLECQQTTCTIGDCTQMACAPGTATRVSGVVYDPAGKVPLYNVVVYVPNGAVPPIQSGASCDRCDASVMDPLVAALTDTSGRFVLEDVPVGANIPLVIQIGKWRRQVTIPNVTACADTALEDRNLTRLPRNQTEGDIPLIAIATGGADSMECLPRRMGLDDSEFTTDTGSGRIHLFSGADSNQDIPTKAFDATLNGGAALTRATSLWSSADTLARYDIVILSCEGGTVESEKPEPVRQGLYDYASRGGRVFASHWHRIWFSNGPAPVPMVGTWADRRDPPDPSPGMINTTFPKGQALAEWLVNVGASTVVGELSILEPRDNIQSVDPMYATPWITTQNPQYAQNPNAVQYLTFNTPLGVPAEQQCGRVVFNDLHVSSTGGDQPGQPFPLGCEQRDLSAQEKAVEFLLFDLSSCIQDDDDPPEPPRPPR